MKTFQVKLKSRSYRIIVGAGLLAKLGLFLEKLNIGSDAYIITNPYLKARYGKILEASLARCGFSFIYKLVPDSEKSKSLVQAGKVLSGLTAYDRKKKVFIIAFGGGVVGDLSGFAASIYRRGTAYIQVPTSLLAQVDSGIGGKTAVDLSRGKNLAGTFYQPKLVLSDIDLLKTLDRRQLRSALAEVIKYALIQDRGLFIYLEKNLGRILAKDRASLEFIVAKCSAIKAGIVSVDEFEKRGLRTVLNFGHTLGHAIEAAGGFSVYNHGEAVSLGMLAACGISVKLKLLKDSDAKRIFELVRKAGLPTKIKGLDPEKIIRSHYHDKKFSGAKNKFVLLCGIGKSLVKENIPLEVISGALRERF
jgi:3-dehydroquinate synthase